MKNSIKLLSLFLLPFLTVVAVSTQSTALRSVFVVNTTNQKVTVCRKGGNLRCQFFKGNESRCIAVNKGSIKLQIRMGNLSRTIVVSPHHTGVYVRKPPRRHGYEMASLYCPPL